ncbi:exosome complex [Cyclospora cayetanensis]|uniref:Ribosomal RNA-processing protein 42 n=1 Tax=Cyclospora cayetanensis TaxID=88456 RepID=A0A1D3CXY2_9EIME|nr:exosome complex [Cyclospora cayetanensis]
MDIEGPPIPLDAGDPANTASPPRGFYSLFFSSFQGAVCHAEATFTREGAACGIRPDGRCPVELRPRILACGILPLSCSSAAIQTEENVVIVTADADLILPGAGGQQEPYSLSVGCGAAEQELADVTGGDGASLSSLLQATLEQLLLPHLVPLKDEGGKASWRISLDVIVLKAGGCLLDAVSLAIWGALKSLRLPSVLIEEAEEKDQGLAVTDLNVSCDERYVEKIRLAFLELSSPPAECSMRASRLLHSSIAAGRPYPIDTVPILLTAAQIGGTYLWDLTDVEAACADSFLVAAILPSGACVALQKFGHILSDCRTLQTTLTISQRLSREILEDLKRQSEQTKDALHGQLDSFFSLASL